jgi:hypothetical protein
MEAVILSETKELDEDHSLRSEWQDNSFRLAPFQAVSHFISYPCR